jgi:hypothetical protein
MMIFHGYIIGLSHPDLFHLSCACLHPPPGVAHFPHYPLCIYTCVFCLSVASSSCLVKPTSVFFVYACYSFVPVFLVFKFWPLCLPHPEPACRSVPYWRCPGLPTSACPCLHAPYFVNKHLWFELSASWALIWPYIHIYISICNGQYTHKYLTFSHFIF